MSKFIDAIETRLTGKVSPFVASSSEESTFISDNKSRLHRLTEKLNSISSQKSYKCSAKSVGRETRRSKSA